MCCTGRTSQLPGRENINEDEQQPVWGELVVSFGGLFRALGG